MESFAITAKLNNKKRAELEKTISALGFTKIIKQNGFLVAEKELPDESLDYKVEFGVSTILFSYSIPQGTSKKRRTLELLPVLLNILIVLEPYYAVSSSLYGSITTAFNDLYSVIDKDALDVSSERDEIKKSYESLHQRYKEMLHSSEENARILLEYERKNTELQKRLEQLCSLGDETLKEEVYKWIKLHNGSIELAEFCKSYNVVPARVEETISVLSREGYIKRSR